MLGAGDDECFAAIDRHGLLDTNTLFQFRKKVRGDYSYHQERLTKLYNGYCESPEHRKKSPPTHECKPITYLTRNPDQFETYEPHRNALVYGLTDHARHALRARGLATKYELRRSNSFVHDYFLGCFTAAFELQARRFRFREELIGDARCPETTKRERAPFYFTSGADQLYPDDLFGNEYEEGKSRFFALEVDRATESKTGKATNSIAAKVKAQQEVLRTAGYKRFGLPNITFLWATSGHAGRILETIREIVEPHNQSRFLVKSYPIFSKPWRTPPELLDVFADWSNAGGAQVNIRKKTTA